MTFEEFQNNLQQIRNYNAKLSKYKVSWFDNEIYKAFKHKKKVESGIILTRSSTKKDNLKKRRKALRNEPLPDSLNDLMFAISGIIGGVIYRDYEEIDYKTDIDGERVKTFLILRDYYLNGYEVEYIASLYNYADSFGVNRTSIYYQRDKGVKELYKLYCERSKEV